MNNLGLVLLNTLLKQRQAKNPHYSLSAMARDLAISQPQLSRIIKGDRRLTPACALKLGQQLQLNSEKLLELLVSSIELK